MVIVHSDIESGCGERSDTTIELMEDVEEPDTPWSPLETPSLLSPLAETPLLPPPLTFAVQHQYVCKPEYDPLFRSRPVQERARWRHQQNEVMAVVELDRNLLTLRAIQAPREVLRSYIKKRMPYPYPTGEYNFLNYKFSDFTLLNSSAKQLKYDIVDLLLTYGGDVNIKEDGNTLAHNAAELNDV